MDSALEDLEFEPTEALGFFTAFGTLYQKPMDSASLARECIPPITVRRLHQLGQQLGLCLKSCRLNWDEFRRPVLAQVREATEAASPDLRWLVILQRTANRVSCLRLDSQQLVELEVAELDGCLTGHAIDVSPAAESARDPDPSQRATSSFGFRWFIPELLKHKAIWREVLGASLVLQLLALGFPLFTQAIIDKVVVHRTESTLIALTVGMAVFVVFTASLTWIRQYLVLHTGNRVDAVLGSHVFEHLFKLPPLYFQYRPTGVIAARLQGIETIREFVSSAAVTLLLDVPFLLIFVALMFWYSVKLTLIVLGILTLIVGASLLVAPLFQRRLNEQFLRGAANQAFVTEYVSGLETVKSLQLEPQLNRRYADLLAVYLGASFRTRQLGNTYGTVANGLEQIMNLLVLALGAYLVMTKPSFTIGMLVAFQMFSSRLSQPMLRLVGLWQQFQQAKLAVTRLGDVMDAPAEPYRLTLSRAHSNAATVQFESVSFRYAGNLPFLYENLSLAVPEGQLVALMGPSGAGKSTLAKLLQGFYQPNSGAIRIGGIDIRHLSANELRANFGVVPQETVLFSGTILDNLKLANPFATFEQVVGACKMAEIHAAIEALPNGYQAEIGERGAGLSGGQRQRLSIARALLKGPRVLIFDEATSSVDLQTAEQIGRTINALKGKATILFIAHALPRSLQPDQILRIGDKPTVLATARKTEADVDLAKAPHRETSP
jgi:ATP-binding cassette, subfamily B, bacterial HlyB/CyaB